ncbi:hypothetical protein VTK73DRAFT_7253 [Phialemonium thermophilum]|uniref:Uncharacterized protein n=1 Tax=Phialemonium thermophilum TaxID=223376 RepID=A0ABR3XTT1_9PEZI
MRLHPQRRPGRQPAAGAAIALLSVLLVRPACAIPYPKDELHAAGYGYLMPRDCNQYCGYNNMYCCSAGSHCYTSNGIAGCSADAGGGYAWYTTTWTLTETFTSTYSSLFPAATSNQDCVPEPGSGQIACGHICCASWQYCAYKGQCMANGPIPGGGGGEGGGAPQTTVITSGGQVITTQYSAPYRVTSGATVTSTGTAVLTTSTGTGNGTVTAGGSSGGLSGGAIAGIVVGTLAGIVILLALCACFLVRGLWHGILALFGLGPNRRRRRGSRETIIEEEERYTRHGSVHSRRDTHGAWYGGRPSSVASRREKRKSGGGGFGWLGIGALAGTILLLLGLRKDKKRPPPTKTRSEVSSSYFDSSGSSRPTRVSRSTRASRHSGGSRATRASRMPPRSRAASLRSPESRAASRRTGSRRS